MQRILSVPAGKIGYTVRRSRRARNLRLQINCDAAVTAVAPWYFPLRVIEKFVYQHADWILNKVAFFKLKPRLILPGGSSADYRQCKQAAADFIGEKLAYYSQFYGFIYRQFFVKKQKTRWGSCSRKGNLNFNYKIIKLPVRLADYIIVHELCHLKEMNHSRRFWSLVERAVPDYRQCRRELKNIY
jgi:predicted metal-dependent hydrolase